MKVVIPSRMNGFYNSASAILSSCTKVVIPSRMNGFYNYTEALATAHGVSCHTVPNERLLQPFDEIAEMEAQSCHTVPNERLLQHPLAG